MSDFLKQQRAVIGVLIISALFICCLFPQLVFHPNDILLVGEGDGLKSYFSFYYHIQYDKSFLHFNGMNYPHGEHYLYTDGFPLIAWLVQALPFLKPNGIGLIHLSLVLSLWLTPLFIYFLLKKFNTETWLALLGAFSLFLLQPQFPRLFSHLSLAYSLFFPLSWYILIRYKEEKASLKWNSISIVNQLFWYFMHPYLGFIITLFYGLDWLFHQFNRSSSLKERLFDLFPILTPVVFMQLFLKLTDPVTDRPVNPYGFFEYQAHWKSIFLPPSGSIHRWLEPYMAFIEVRWEGQSYIGYLSILMLIIGMIMVIPFVQNRFRSIGTMHRSLLYAFIGASILLVLSFGFPFNGNPTWLNFVPFLKQFRALGRFSWPFYYVAGVMGFVLLSHLYRRFSKSKKSHSYITAGVIFLFISVQFIESWNLRSFPESFTPNLFQAKNLNREQKQLIESSKKGRANYQAILPLPWFHVGSETFGKEASSETLLSSFLISAHTGIPIHAVMMGRTSKKQTMDYFRLFNLTQTHLLSVDRSLLLVHPLENSLYAEDEQLIYDESKPYFNNKLVELRILSKQRKKWKEPFSYELVFKDDFEDKTRWQSMVKNGRFHGSIENYNTILSLDSTILEPNQWYDLSFDYYPDWTQPIANVCYLEFIQPETKAITWFYNRSIGSFPGISEKAIRVNLRFKTQTFRCEYHCFLVGNSKNVHFDLDHLVLKKRSN
jgi:hypothetical protein